MKLLLLLLTALSAASALTSPSGLSHAQLAKIRKLGRVVIPTYIPPGFRLKSLKTDVGEYDLDYRGPHDADLLIQMASDGIGSIILGADTDQKVFKDTFRKVRNATFGLRNMEVFTAKGDREFGVDWIDLGERAKPRFLCISGSSMSADLGAKIWERVAIFELGRPTFMSKCFAAAIAVLVSASVFGSSSGLTAGQIATLKKAGKVVIPTYIPPGFKVVLCSAFAGSYTIEYRGLEAGSELTIEMASEGIGDIVLGGDADKKTLKAFKGKVSNSTFGNRDLYIAAAKGYLAFSTSWVDLGKKAKPRFFCIIGHQVPVEFGDKVYHGMKYLN